MISGGSLPAFRIFKRKFLISMLMSALNLYSGFLEDNYEKHQWRIASPGECLIEEKRRKEGARDSGRKEKKVRVIKKNK